MGMIQRIDRSPRGYSYLTGGMALPKPGEVISFNPDYKYDPVIEDIWQRYLNLVGTDAPLNLVLLLVERLKYMFGDFRHWVWVQATSNRAVQGYALDFILDTIKFVQSGSRQISIDNWMVLIEAVPATNGELIDSRVDQFNDVVLPDTATLLSDWLKRDNGVRDIFQTAKILFGKAN